ncbi:MAG TPA: DUF805 domain-containing protein [Thermoanaerobaculia bacterium]|jgi:uncharacterized membrane protein YhaH (DUF805 family)|nr:DUF805 domain-containing protein [Thermoanaerobaculia bacterium]
MRLSLLFGFHDRVDRRLYLRTGFTLMALKYLVDAVVIRLVSGETWTPIDYFLPLLSIRGAKVNAFPAWLSVVLIVWTIPFLWIGVSMTLRRALDAGRSPWLCLLFFVPVVNYAVMLWLCTLPSSPDVRSIDEGVTPSATARVSSAMAGMLAAVGLGALALLLNVFLLEEYGTALFVATPFLAGAACGLIYNQGHARTPGQTAAVVTVSLVLIAGCFLLFALEGVVCLAMAFPLAWMPALLGGAVGRAVAIRRGGNRWSFAPCLLLLPVASLLDLGLSSDPVREVVTAIEIDAPPAQVWKQVVSFSRIESEPEWPFRLGLAYPVEATIAGTGVGAIRRCEFSTGAFVEPITVWDEPHRLSFSVTDQPPALEEWSPYRQVYAPHVKGYFRSVKGEFRLVSLPGGRTRLEGSTWYTLDIHPRLYWTPITDMILHRIHGRVLAQVREKAEAAARAAVAERVAHGA